ncbi:MAG: hypothetical protein JW936_05980 [Sedimentisphaerales bacterium]|nr:hypothetical protein [Sedimentisphaerales bacterium]
MAQEYDHRTSDPDVDFTYDDLQRLTRADYDMGANYETFPMDDLGNRVGSAYLRDGSTDTYDVDELTNRWVCVSQRAKLINNFFRQFRSIRRKW